MAAELPDIDQDALGDVLDAISKDTELSEHIKKQGSPTNPTRWWVRTRTQRLRTTEVKACISWPSDWRKGDKGLNSIIWDLFYDYLVEGKGVGDVATKLAKACGVDVEDYVVAIEISGLRISSGAQRLGDFTFGPLQAILENHGLEWTEVMDERVPEQPSDTTVVMMELTAPEPAKAVDSAYIDLERCLDLIATNHLRSVFQGGPPWMLGAANHAWCWDASGGAVRMGFRDPWLTRASFSYNPEADGTTSRPPLEASQQPWVDLPDGKLARELRRAYEFVGAAIRNARQPSASLLLAVAGLESVYVPDEDQSQKVAGIVAKRLQLAVARDAGTTDPNEIQMLYDLRNRIMHSAESHQWDDKEARDILGDIYRHLDQLAAFAVENSCSTFAELEDHLTEEQVLIDARSWAEEWRSRAEESRKKTVHPEREEDLQRVEGFWGNVKGAIPKPDS